MQQQMSFLDISYGKTYPELSAPTKERTSEKFLKKSSASKTVLPMFLDLRRRGYASGNLVGQSWEMDTLSLGAPSTHSFGECPRDVEESTLSQILEANVDPKYYLSATACRGVLRRAVNRGKELPTLLKIALCLQGKLTIDEIRDMSIFREGEISAMFDGAKVYDARGNGDGKIVPTLTGDHEDRITDYTAVIVGCWDMSRRDGARWYGEVSPTLVGMAGTGGNNTPCVIYIDYAAFNQGVNAKYDFGVDDKTAFTLTGKGPGAVCYCIQGNCIDRAEIAKISPPQLQRRLE